MGPAPETAAAVGTRAPRFAGRDQHGAPLSSADFLGRRAVLLVFVPYAFSGVCAGELRAVRDELPRLANDRVQVIGVSCDAMFSQRVWADTESFGFPLLSDHWPHGALARAFGVFDEAAGVAGRGTFLVDSGGVIRWSTVRRMSESRDVAAYVAAVGDLT